ncbi:MAG: hypothetical protein Q9160_006960 [Pyrenula sp. 1 TL-2023]
MATTEAFLDRKSLVLYGTETGNAQEIAEEIGRTLERLRFDAHVCEFDESSAENLANNTLSVFVVSTTGQGDFPSNSRRFWASLLRRKLPASYLADVDFTVVGLGDSSYPKFNFAARKLRKRLTQLGATEICEACEADEQDDEGIEGDFLSWVQHFRTDILETFPLPADVTPIPDDVPLPQKWRLEISQELTSGPHELKSVSNVPLESNGHLPYNHHEAQPQVAQNDVLSPNQDINSHLNKPNIDERFIPGNYRAILTANQRLTSNSHWQDVRILSLDVKEDLPYYPGDALAITPKNIPSDVSALIELMGWKSIADMPINIAPNTSAANRFRHPPSSPNLPNLGIVLTLRTLLLNHLDILAIPRRSFFSHIAFFTTDSFHRERLLEFTDSKYLDEYYDYATRPRRSILEILAEFDSVKIPWQEAINVFPIIRPRQFSIASGGSLKQFSNGQGTRFELLVAIVRYRTVIRKIREGVCTRYLASLAPGSTLNITLRSEGRFHRASNLQQKGLEGTHLLIGTGTGLAPLRALIHEKDLLASQGQLVGSTTLFFGCRSPESDFLFRDAEVRDSSSQPPNGNSPTNDNSHWTPTFTHPFHLITAFSRAQRERVYVQDRIREHADLVFERVHRQNATVVICGSTGAMPRGVKEALAEAVGRGMLAEEVADEGGAGAGVSEEERVVTAGKEYLERMEKEGRLKEETW